MPALNPTNVTPSALVRHNRGMKWLLLVCVVGVVAVIAMPALSDSTQPSLVSTGAPCVDTRDRHLETTTDPAPAQVTTLLAVLRRPQRPSDRIPNPDDLALLPISG